MYTSSMKTTKHRSRCNTLKSNVVYTTEYATQTDYNFRSKSREYSKNRGNGVTASTANIV